VQRNRLGVAAAAAIAIAVMLGAILSTIGFVKASRNAAIARQEATRAQVQARRVRDAQKFTTSLLANADPKKGERSDITVRELLDKAVEQLDRGEQPNPQLEGSVRAQLADTYRSLNLMQPSEQQWQKALSLETRAIGSNTPEAARAMSGLALAKIDSHDLDEADRLLKQALPIQREQLTPDDPQLGDTINISGLLAQKRGDFKTAQAYFSEALKVYQQHPEDGPAIADAMTNLATVLHQLGDDGQAMEMARKALSLRKKLYGDQHIDVWNSLMNIASLLDTENDLGSAEQMRRDALALAQKLLEEKHPKTILSMSGLARTLWLRGTPAALDEASALQSRAMQFASDVDGAQSVAVAQGQDLLACIARDRGRLDEAVDLFRKALATRSAVQGAEHPDTAAEMSQLADALTRSGKPQEAVDLARKALDIRKRVYPAGHAYIWSTTSVLGGALAGAGQFDQAEPLLLDAYKGLSSGRISGKRPQRDSAGRLVLLYEKWGKADQAEQWRKQLAALPSPASQPSSPKLSQVP
jgi:tetratricopeptide (TPR) repeat protein